MIEKIKKLNKHYYDYKNYHKKENVRQMKHELSLSRRKQKGGTKITVNGK